MAENPPDDIDENLPCFEINWLPKQFDKSQTTARLPTLSEKELDQIVSHRHSEKTKRTTNWSVSTFKGN